MVDYRKEYESGRMSLDEAYARARRQEREYYSTPDRDITEMERIRLSNESLLIYIASKFMQEHGWEFKELEDKTFDWVKDTGE